MRRRGCKWFVVYYEYQGENGDRGRQGYAEYECKEAAVAMRRFFAEFGGRKDRAGNRITPIAVKEF